MKTKQTFEQTQRALAALVTDMHERDALDARIRVQVDALAKHHGVSPPPL